MTPRGTTRIEFALLAEDAELLTRYANAHHTTVSEIVRQALYDHNPVLKRAKTEREDRTWREVEERRKLRAWNGDDPVKRHEAIVSEAIERPNNH